MDLLVHVELAQRGYGVHIGAGLLDRAGQAIAAALPRPARRAFIVRDSGVPDATFARLAASLAAVGIGIVTLTITPSETDKSLATVERLLTELSRAALGRFDPVVALGGGIVGDVAGFAAATYRRGVPLVQCPTTLLAMVDASVGGKTGVNLPVDGNLRKNFVGAFHQPVAVFADVSALDSLPPRELRCGLAECVKHGLIGAHAGEAGLLEWTEANLEGILNGDVGARTELIARNVAVKAAIVAGDEREEAEDEAGGRALLNLGHSYGHAIETIPGLSPDDDPAHAPLKHGEAVALGLLAACRCSAAMGRCDEALPPRVAAILARIGLPTVIAGLPEPGEIIARMKHDKKVLNDALRLVLPLPGFRAEIVRNPPAEVVSSSIEGIRLPVIA